MTLQKNGMLVAGIMSGTSADGVDVALVRVIAGDQDRVAKLKILGHTGRDYPRALRAKLLRVMEGAPMAAGEFSRLNWRLGKFYAECVERACEASGIAYGTPAPGTSVGQSRTLQLVGMHGQTIFHEAKVATWQMGEASVIRERLGVPVVSDFRSADVAAGGQGAPLVPMLDFCLFRSKTRNRVLLNLGGIANVTAIPAGAGLDGLLAFDTGPANMVADAVMQADFGKAFDRSGRTASRGQVLSKVLGEVLRDPYFAAAPPKSCGREQFGAAFVDRFRKMVKAAGGSAQDAVATATELTARSILDAYGQFCWSHLGQRAPLARATDLVVAGGGVNNVTLMRRLSDSFRELGVKVVTSDALGLGPQAKEAVAFALLAWLTWNRLPGNVPSATGAIGARVLGKISW